MKKTLTAALTTALVVGAASTTFAAANPFSDVPMDHWAYDAVAQLADDGIVEGYGDGTYRGENEITRYEMAQMVAKAMAKEDQVNAQQKAMIDRLAAEFSDELNNLGVRVSNLESRIDNVKWTGELQYTYSKKSVETEDSETDNELMFRLEPEATVNDHWKVMARVEAAWNASEDKGDKEHNSTLSLKRAWAAGHYGITDINAGLMPVLTEQGVVIDDNMTGVSVTVGEGQQLSGTVLAGRLNLEDTKYAVDRKAADLMGLTLNWQPTEKLHVAGEYYRLSDEDSWQNRADENVVMSIWGLGAKYAFDQNVALSAGYWKNTNWEHGGTYIADPVDPHNMSDRSDRAWNVQLDYKGAEPENMHSFGLYAAYRYLGKGAVIASTFDGADWGEKGWEVGGQYTFAKNIVGSLLYFDGRQIEKDTDNKVKKGWARLEYLF
ncbi:putative porin [Selenomonas sp.]|uniref:putative porin n=1 Tax=Selenomonas sp. TaxID=2053611 RepID=UPI003FA2E0CE